MAATQRKPKRRTRERILEVSLKLFNDFGERNVSTTAIADEMGISPGNLYYHFGSKDEIVESLFGAFEHEIEATLSAPGRRAMDVEDIWLFVHLLFEIIWRHRFLYRDLSDLLTRNRTLEVHFKRILAHKVDTARRICRGLVEAGEMTAREREVEALATNMVVAATYWLPYAYARDPRRQDEGRTLGEGAYQVMSLTAPFLVGDARALFDRLAREYLEPGASHGD
jgi:AcrR family transcriptional regulator